MLHDDGDNGGAGCDEGIDSALAALQHVLVAVLEPRGEYPDLEPVQIHFRPY